LRVESRGVPLLRSIQSQRSLSPQWAQGAQSKDRPALTPEAGAPLWDFWGGPGSMIAFLPSLPALDRRDDNHLMQCSVSFSFSSLNAHAPSLDVGVLRNNRFGRDLARFILAV